MIDITLLILILSLIVYEVTDLLVTQDGPYNVFEKIRNYFNVYDTSGEYHLVGSILSCPYCTQVWVTLLISLLVLPFIAISYKLLIPLAVMGLVAIILDIVR